jgi:PAS domain S-box-containing protein
VWLENRYSPIYSGKEIVGLHCVSRDITEEKIKEAELDNSKTQLSNILSNLPGMAYRCLNDEHWTMKFVSSGALQLTGYKPEDLIDNRRKSFASIIHPEDREIGKKEIREALRKKKSFEIEYRIIDRAGKVRCIWEKGTGVYEKNKLLYIEGFINDISERKNAEQELNQRWLNYRNLIDAMPVGIFIHVDGRIQFGNKMAYEIADITKKDNLATFSLIDFLAKKDHPLAVERIRRAMAGEDTPFIEYYITTRKGVKKVVRTKSSPIIYNSMKAVQIVIQDITHEKKLEEERIKVRLAEQVNKELQQEVALRQESEQKLKAIFESTTHLIWTINRNKEIVSYNKQYYNAVKNLCGVNLRPGLNIERFSNRFSKEDYRKLRAAHESAFKGKDARIEIPLQAIDGKTYYREMHFYPVRINGQINEIAAVAQDTTERRNYEKKIVEHSSKLKAIFDSGNQHIWTIDKNFGLTSFNKNYADAYRFSSGREARLHESVLDSVKGTPYYKLWKDKYKEALNGKSVEFEVSHVMPDGRAMYGQIFMHPVYDNRNEIIEVAGIAQNITDRKNYEKQIIEQSARLRAIFKSGSQLMWTVDRKMQLTSFNKNYADAIFELYGTYPELNTDINRLPRQIRSVEYDEFWSGKYEEVLHGNSVEFDTERTTRDGRKIYRHIFLHPIYNEKNQVVEVSAVGYDITGQKKAQEEIMNKQSQLAAIINTTDDIIFSIDRDYRMVEFNEVLKNIVRERTGEEITPGRLIFELLPPQHKTELISIYKKVLSGQSITAIEAFVVAGEERLYEAHYNPIRTSGAITGIAVFSRDITEQKRSEENTLKSLKEKEVLLKEVHHRVKNNLQVISSILNLQTSYLKDKGTINLLKECQNRIKTMAFIHESLYQNKDFSQINFSEYIVTLVKNLFYSFEANQQKIKTNFDIDTIFLNLDMSIPCGLIMNELVSNALKYAFEGGREGAIFIKLKKERGRVRMVVADNGRGIPEHIDFRNTETLGLQLVTTLTEQINGTITMNRNKGTTFEIIF